MPAATHLAHRAFLTVELLTVRCILSQSGGENLERNRVIRPQVQRIIHLAHAAAANKRTHLVVTLNNGATEPLRRTNSGIRGSGTSGGRNRSICRRTRGHRRNPAWAGSIHTSQHFSPPTWAEAMPKGAEQVNTQRILTKCRWTRLQPKNNGQRTRTKDIWQGSKACGGSKVVNTCQLWHS